MSISITDVQFLRKITSAGVIDCKNALTEAGGDYDKAIEILRKNGRIVAANRGGCDVSEGCVLSSVKGNFAAIVAVKCETDFSAKEVGFVKMVNNILNIAIKNKPRTIEELTKLKLDEGLSIWELMMDKAGIIREKVELGAYEYITSKCVFSYVHPGNRLASIVGFNQEDLDKQLIKDVAMQIAAMNPVSIDKDTVPENIISLEKKIARDKAIINGKSNIILTKIEEGALSKYFQENTLMEQVFIKNSKIKIKDLLNNYSKELQVTAFRRVSLFKH